MADSSEAIRHRVEAERTRLQHVIGIMNVSADSLEAIAENADDAVQALRGACEVLADINKALEEVWVLARARAEEVSNG